MFALPIVFSFFIFAVLLCSITQRDDFFFVHFFRSLSHSHARTYSVGRTLNDHTECLLYFAFGTNVNVYNFRNADADSILFVDLLLLTATK